MLGGSGVLSTGQDGRERRIDSREGSGSSCHGWARGSSRHIRLWRGGASRSGPYLPQQLGTCQRISRLCPHLPRCWSCRTRLAPACCRCHCCCCWSACCCPPPQGPPAEARAPPAECPRCSARPASNRTRWGSVWDVEQRSGLSSTWQHASLPASLLSSESTGLLQEN